MKHLKHILTIIIYIIFINPTANASENCTVFDDYDECYTSNFSTCLTNDSLALVAFYNSTNGPNWTNTWTLTDPVSTWYGITLSADGCSVICFDLADDGCSAGNLGSNNLTGNIPPELGNLTNLTTLNLSGNYLTGEIPSELGNLSNLTILYLNYNELTGEIPPELGNLVNITHLYLNSNQLMGEIPPELGNLTTLSYLSLGTNNLTGEIPPELGNLVNFTSLYLSNNNLSGCLDINLINLCSTNSTTSVSLNNNPLLPWEGNFYNFCNTSGSSTDQIGAPCDDGDPSNGTNDAINEDCSCAPMLMGCIDATACNYNEAATTDDGSCLYVNIGDPCDDGDPSNGTNDVINAGCSCGPMLMGCIDATACNYNEAATTDDGSCLYPNTCDFCSDETDGTGIIIDGDLDNDGVCDCLSLTNDSLVLVALYNATDGPNWSPNNWNLTNPVSTWPGVTLSANGCSVTSLILIGGPMFNNWGIPTSNSNLSGNIPPELGNLVNLTTLNLDNNELIGEIPTELGNLVHLTSLSLKWNNLTGEIPPELGNLSNLTDIDLWGNSLTGEIPSELGNLGNLLTLYLGNNDLTGEIPSELENLVNLIELRLYSNDLIGEIPPELANLSNLTILDLSFNDLTGEIPPELGSLSTLNLGANQLTGEIPPELGMGNLTYLNLEYNQLTGGIPPELGIGNLTYLNLAGTGLTGQIPPELGMGNLSNIRLGWNNLTGEIPSELGNLVIAFLDLRYNNLSGCLDMNLMNLCSVFDLYFYDNPLLPWEGDFSQFCATSESSTDQIGAPCDDGDPSNGTNDAINADCSCEPTVINGCTDATACNYNASATTNDGSCLYLDAPCDDGDDSNGTNDVIDEDCNCGPTGCIDVTACNYNVSATIDDGSCLYPNICDACSGETDGTGIIIDGDLDNDGVCDCPGLMNDSLALVALYNATDGPNWTNTWTLTDPMSTWFGVTLSADGCSVTNLDLSNNELTGEIPPELGSLANLTILDLVYNNLIGEIPPELGNLVNLTGLYLAYNGSNGLTGEIPSELGNLVNLTELGLEWNNLTGQIPSELGSLANLTILDLADNSLTGEIPSELGNLVNLTYFNFGYNDLSGCLDMNLMNLCSVTIYSSYNPLLPWGGDFDQFCATSGSSIDQIGAPCDDGDDSNGTNDVINADCSCEPILVNGCIDANACNYNVSATINDGSCLYPNICDTCSGETDGTGIIIDGDLDDNGFCDIDQNCLTNDSLVLVALYNFTDGFNWTNTWTLTDPVSTWFGVNLSLDGCSVTYVDLAENNLTGEIPTELGNLSNLTVLDLDLNSLTGKIPMELENLSNLNILKLSFNGLTGEIPNELSNLLNLEDLFLNENNLTGEIPTELENLINLKNLQLSVNNLTGEIPNELSNLLDLERLSLNTNNLSGNIPTELGNLSNLTTLKLDDNELTGEIPPELGSLSNLTTLKLNDNELTGEIPPELGNLVNLLLINISSNNLSGCLDINLMNLCSVPTLNFSNNPILPWKGSFFQFCSTPGNSTDQIGTPCDDGDASNGTNDVINADCSCGPAIVGCTDTTACNYDPIAEFDDASCLYGSDCPSIGFELSAKIFLEGPYNGGGTMLSSLDDLIPLNQPYNTAPYNYMGTETALIIPDNVVDWVLVEMRSGIPSTTNQSTLLAEIKVGLLLENGNIVHTDGVSPLTFETLNEGESYYLCIRHRNHLDVLSATPITASNTMTYDFTTDANKAFGSQQLKELESGVYALYGGDYTHEGIIQTTDYDFWADAPAIINVYTNTDGTLDGVAQNTDYDLWFGNKAKIGVMEVRLE